MYKNNALFRQFDVAVTERRRQRLCEREAAKDSGRSGGAGGGEGGEGEGVGAAAVGKTVEPAS